MKRIRIGTSGLQIAVILEQVKPRAGTYKVAKVVLGKYDNDSCIFKDEEGNLYKHFIRYDTNEKEPAYFIGRMPLPAFSELIIKENKNTLLENYLSGFNKFTYQLRQGNIICTEPVMKVKYNYVDDDTLQHDFLSRALYDGMQDMSEMLLSEEGLSMIMSEYMDSSSSAPKLVASTSDYKATDKKLHEIVEETKKYIRGQDEAIKKAVTQIYEHLKYPNAKKQPILIIGPTGSGKTYIFEILAKLFDLPISIYPVPGLSQSGYVGASTDEILEQLIVSCGGDASKAERGIIILDEIDKLASRSNNDGKISTEGVQNELLTMISGKKKLVKLPNNGGTVEIDTSKILFVCTGAFQEIFDKPVEKKLGFGAEQNKPKKEEKIIETDKLVKYGIKRELAGRLPLQIRTKELTEEDLLDIILNKEDSIMKRNEKLLYESCGIKITNIEEVAALIAKDAITKKVGARGLDATVTNMFSEIKYIVYDSIGEYDTLTLGKNILTDSSDFILSKTEENNRGKLRQRTKTSE